MKQYFIPYQYLNDKKAATPPLIQTSSCSFVANSIYITKFVLCPVVDNVPLLDTTLYVGQLYIPVVGVSLSGMGTNCITGTSEYNSFGFGHAKRCFFTSHLAPSKNIPYK